MGDSKQQQEFSRIYKYNAIKQVEEKEVSLKASEEERLSLAKRIQVSEIKEFRINAVLGVVDEPNTVHAVGILNATVMQDGDKDPQEIVTPVDVFFKPEADMPSDDAFEDDRDIEPYSNGEIDFGEVCVQYLSLSLMPLLDLSDFDVEFEEVYSEPRTTPFADLERLKES